MPLLLAGSGAGPRILILIAAIAMSVDNASWQVAEQYFGRSCAHPTGNGSEYASSIHAGGGCPFNDIG